MADHYLFFASNLSQVFLLETYERNLTQPSQRKTFWKRVIKELGDEYFDGVNSSV